MRLKEMDFLSEFVSNTYNYLLVGHFW